MNDEDKLFMSNPLKAIWIKLGQVDEKLKRITQEIDDEDYSDKTDDLSMEGFYGD